MPTVPYNPIPGVAPGQRPDASLSVQAPLQAFGGGDEANQAYGQAHALSQDAFHIAQEAQDQNDLADVMKATAALTDYATDAQFNPETGFLAKKGDGARNLQAPVREGFTKQVSALSEGLKNDRQREMFQTKADERWAHMNTVLGSHMLQERQNYISQQWKATTDSNLDAARGAAMIGDIAGIDKAAKDTSDGTLAWAHLNHVAPIVADQAEKNDVSTVYRESIDAMLKSGADLVAKDQFDRVESKLNSKDKEYLIGRIGEVSTISKATRIVDGLFQKDEVHYFDRPNQTGQAFQSEKDAVDAVREATKDSTPQVREKAEDLALRRFHIEKLDQKSSEDKTYEATVSELRKTGDLESIQKSPAWYTMPEADKRQVEATAARIAKGDSPYAKVSDPQVTAGFFGLDKEDVAKLSKADILKLAPKVTEAKYGEIETHWNKALQKEEDAAFKTTQADDTHIFDTIKRAGIVDLQNVKELKGLKDDKNKSKAEAYQPIWDEVIDKYREFFNDNNKNPNQEQKRVILRDIIIDKTLHKPQTFMQKWGSVLLGSISGNPVAGVIGQEGLKSYLNPGIDISPDDRARIAKNISMFGGEVSQEKVQMIRRAELMQASDAEIKKLARE